jgi:hypothetical protein
MMLTAQGLIHWPGGPALGAMSMPGESATKISPVNALSSPKPFFVIGQ